MTDFQRHLTLRGEPNPTPLGVQAVVPPQDGPAAEGLDEEAALTTTRAAHAELTFTQINHRTQKT